MAPMPEQNNLPFPDGQPDPDRPQTPTPAPVPAPSARVPMAAGATPRPVRRPLWARLLGRLADPWLGLTIEPEQPGQYNDGRPVVYVLEDYGLSNALILDKACREAGLPSPL